ncbi:hypothetical protein MSAN_00805100 [Mycena sanguinolenta]|uniref:F-box domain-containing protein n=1 Tax=Mycena sanguinolenta TaxID=230812 RepID=A0A8H6YUL1_9AGAR|nr:hypothetical protein MSAN_00805100 [Mycena sanguinolenta]
MSTKTTIFSLPNELLGAIAAAGQEERVADSYGPDPRWHTDSKIDNFRSEWVLSHVSRRFRDVIINSPALWTLIGAKLDAWGSVEMLKLYLDRSCACKISITLREFPKNTDADLDDDALELRLIRVSQIVPHISRVRTLRILLGTERIVELLSPFRVIAAPHLQHLEIIKASDEEDATLVIFSSGAPKLTFVKIVGLALDLPTAPWTASLTYLWLQRYQFDWVINNLVPLTAQCPLLVHLHFDTHFRTKGDRVRIPTLKSLHITISVQEVAHNHLVDIVNLFDAPALAEFTVRGTHGDQICRLFNSTGLTQSSFPALTSLSFSRPTACACDAENTLYRTISSPPVALFPALSNLTLINQCFTPHLIRDILGPGSQAWSFLKTFELVPKRDSLQDVRSALEDVVAKRRLQQSFPAIKLFRPRRLGNWGLYANSQDEEVASFP